jgi:hypothetical protein
MHMLPIRGMHMHSAPQIRLDPSAPIRAPTARAGIESKRAAVNIRRVRGKGHLWIQKTPGVLRRQAIAF